MPGFRNLLLVALALLLALPAGLAAQGAERVPVPTPPGGGPGVTLGVQDMRIPVSGVFDGDPWHETAARPPVRRAGKAGPDKAFDEIGGDDVRIYASPDSPLDCSMDIAANGDIYLAVEHVDGATGAEIRIYRSVDGGTLWDQWAVISDPDPIVEYRSPSLVVAEGAQDRCFVAYSKKTADGTVVCVAGSDLALADGDFSGEIVVMDSPDYRFYDPCLATDAGSFSSYYLYLVAWAYQADGGDIWFARSVNQGTSFESAYAIATLSGTDRDYKDPWVCYGYGGYVHVAWQYHSRDGSFDSATRYRRAASYADGGLSAWEGIQFLTSAFDDSWEEDQRVAASLSSEQVLIAFSRLYDVFHTDDPGVLVSTDGGVSFGGVTVLEGGLHRVDGLVQQPSTGDWILAGDLYGQGYQRAGAADPTNWGPVAVMEDQFNWSAMGHRNAVALDPAHDDRVARAWTYVDYSDSNSLLFDAEWRGDPGYPNLEPGFPLDLPAQPVSPPALVDLGGDGRLEIVFGDASGLIHALEPDGDELPGWPVDVGAELSDGPIAVGNLDGQRLFVVAGTTDGRVFAFHADGTPADGWPYDMGVAEPVYVSIGAVGGPFPRTVVALAGDRLRWLSFHGSWPPGAWGWNVSATGPSGPAAIGDLDGDGVSEAVFAMADHLFAFDMHSDQIILSRVLSADASDALSLADLDLDGDVEIIVPTVTGDLYVLQGDGTPYPGSWPFHSSPASALHSAAVGDCLGPDEPEIAVSSMNFQVHLLWADGEQAIGYPVSNDGWYIYDAPVMGRVEGPTPDVVVGARGQKAWAWDNFGGLIPGWPKVLRDHIYLTPAMGDIDLDGRNEIVLLGSGQIAVVDVGTAPAPADQTWPMYGHDPQRTGCSDCPEDVVTAVGDDPEAVTRVSFAPPSPNPVHGRAMFSFALPVRAQVSLAVYDLRGGRVREVTRSELPPGPHVVGWDGRDERGRSLAAGTYLARLRVRGPGLDQVLTRKVTVLR